MSHIRLSVVPDVSCKLTVSKGRSDASRVKFPRHQLKNCETKTFATTLTGVKSSLYKSSLLVRSNFEVETKTKETDFSLEDFQSRINSKSGLKSLPSVGVGFNTSTSPASHWSIIAAILSGGLYFGSTQTDIVSTLTNLQLPGATETAIAATLLTAPGLIWNSRKEIVSFVLSKLIGKRVDITGDIILGKEGLVLKDVRCVGVEVGAVVVRGTPQELWQAFIRAKDGSGPVSVDHIHLKDLHACVHRDTLLTLFSRASALGFSVRGRLRFTNMSLEITGGGGGGVESSSWDAMVNPTLLVQRLEMVGIHHRMSAAEVAASIAHLKELSVGGKLPPSSGASRMLVRVQRRLTRTLSRLEGMNLQAAIGRVLSQLDQIPSVTQGALAPLLQPLVQMVAVQKLAQSRDPVGDAGRLAIQSLTGSRQWSASASNLRAAGVSLAVVQELVAQGVPRRLLNQEDTLRRVVDALQPEGALLPALAERGALVSSLVHQRYLLTLLDQGFLDLLLVRRELLLKLLESQVLESIVRNGALKVLIESKATVFQQLITGHAMEVLIDTDVLPALLNTSSPSKVYS